MNSDRKEIFSDFFDPEISDEVKLLYIEQIENIKDYVSLMSVSRECQRLVGASQNYQKSRTSFFDNFTFDLFCQGYILHVSKVTVADIRLGNQLVIQAIDLFKKQLTPSPLAPQDNNQCDPEILLRKAMYRYGSYLAMRCLKELSRCPGRKSLEFIVNPTLGRVFHIDAIISIYKMCTKSLLEEISEVNFSPDDYHEYLKELDSANYDLDRLVNAFIYALKETYMKSPASWYHTPNYFSIKMKEYRPVRVEDYIAREGSEGYMAVKGKVFEYLQGKNGYPVMQEESPRPPQHEEFDAEGYIGLKAPKTADAWYLREDIVAEHLEREQLIDGVIPAKQLFLK